MESKTPPNRTWYAPIAVQAFLGKSGESDACAAVARAEEPASFDLMIHVLRGGVLSFPLAVPETEVAKCVREKTTHRLFPPATG